MTQEEEGEYPYWKNEIVQSSGKRKRTISYRPTKTQLNAILKRNPEDLLLDEDGRIYGVIRDEDNPIYLDLLQRGSISQNSDDNGDQLMFVWLPSGLKGNFASEKKRRNKGYSGFLPDEMLEMPGSSQTILLYNYTDYNSGPIAEMEIIEYCERNSKSARISLIRSSLRGMSS